ncbi:MAG: hypothetical protein A3G25_19280 [Betaproteobacteria bacterium RIFCSPLOWO2_12_FULL_63_13]|nr:MAG: hypothetical protein A3H32_16690 [Betaproteobacteria bacterium RIFCSPLOWO2_02_FULL_63_19]OGA52013.1 MAG: hypothetical protein A3G25_19280 [Betaproteobacteria bacterium RIFCSPLOWO2_12_FULL_63_13]
MHIQHSPPTSLAKSTRINEDLTTSKLGFVIACKQFPDMRHFFVTFIRPIRAKRSKFTALVV